MHVSKSEFQNCSDWDWFKIGAVAKAHKNNIQIISKAAANFRRIKEKIVRIKPETERDNLWVHGLTLIFTTLLIIKISIYNSCAGVSAFLSRGTLSSTILNHPTQPICPPATLQPLPYFWLTLPCTLFVFGSFFITPCFLLLSYLLPNQSYFPQQWSSCWWRNSYPETQTTSPSFQMNQNLILRRSTCCIKNEHYQIRITHVRRHDWPEFLLSSCIPELQLVLFLIPHTTFCVKINSNGGLC